MDGLKTNNAEMAKELIEVTGLQSQTKLEVKNLNAELRQKQVRQSELEEILRGKDQETAAFKEEQIQMMHQQKAEFIKVQEQLKA